MNTRRSEHHSGGLDAVASHRLVTVIPPVQGGVWDFTHALTAELGGDARILLTRSLDAAALTSIDGDTLLLQYSGYGFARRGAPWRLLQQISGGRSRFKRLGVFFHELYAFGPPWGSAFWLSPLQRHIARRLAELADFWIASCETYAHWLRQFAHTTPHAVLQSCSNVGEPRSCSEKRRPVIVVFGGAPLRQSTYRVAGDALFTWARRQGLEILDVGPPLEDAVTRSRVRSAGAVLHGRLAPEDVSRLLAEAMYGVVAYRGDALAKSGVFAAYCAHGVCPVVFANKAVTFDRLNSGHNFVSGLPPPGFEAAAAARVGHSAWNWYQDHRLECHSKAVVRLLAEASQASDAETMR